MAQWMLQLVTLIVTTLAGSAVVRDADALAVDQVMVLSMLGYPEPQTWVLSLAIHRDHGRTQPGFLQVEAEVQTDAETLWRQLPPEMQGRLREEASRDVLIQILQTMTSLVNQQNERMGAVEAEQLAARKRGDALEARCSTRITNALLALRPGTIAVSGEPSAPSTGAANASAAPAGPQKLFGKVISPVVSSPEDPKPQRCGTCAQCRSTPMRKCAGLTKWYARQRKRAQEDEDGREKKIAKVPMDEHRPLGNGNPDDEPGDGGGEEPKKNKARIQYLEKMLDRKRKIRNGVPGRELHPEEIANYERELAELRPKPKRAYTRIIEHTTAATLRAKGVQRAKEERKQEKEERARQLREAKFACLREEGDVLIDSVVVKGGRCEGILAGLKLDAVFEMEGLRVRLVEMVGTCGQLQLVDNPTKPLLRRLQAWLQKYLQMLVDVWTKVADEEPVLYASVQVEELSFRDHNSEVINLKFLWAVRVRPVELLCWLSSRSCLASFCPPRSLWWRRLQRL
ncbi:unnamed protein product [Symbiodinium microadriaticum]|nr:unnamed protein product [Symbiodinium microadriaticum]